MSNVSHSFPLRRFSGCSVSPNVFNLSASLMSGCFYRGLQLLDFLRGSNSWHYMFIGDFFRQKHKWQKIPTPVKFPSFSLVLSLLTVQQMGDNWIIIVNILRYCDTYLAVRCDMQENRYVSYT